MFLNFSRFLSFPYGNLCVSFFKKTCTNAWHGLAWHVKRNKNKWMRVNYTEIVSVHREQNKNVKFKEKNCMGMRYIKCEMQKTFDFHTYICTPSFLSLSCKYYLKCIELAGRQLIASCNAILNLRKKTSMLHNKQEEWERRRQRVS